MAKKYFLLLVIWSVPSLGSTLVKVDTTPVHGAAVTCNGEMKGITPIQFSLKNGTYKCSLIHKLTEEVEFALEVGDERTIAVSLILTPGMMTEAQKKVTILRTPKKNKKYAVEDVKAKDFSKDAEEYVLSKRGPEAQRLINTLAELKQPNSDGGAVITGSELRALQAP